LQDTTIVCEVKFIKPNGKLMSNSNTSPENSSYIDTLDISIGQNEVELTGWGSESGGVFEPGINSLEIWYNKMLVGRQFFVVKN
jgi:hypothetical protein